MSGKPEKGDPWWSGRAEVYIGCWGKRSSSDSIDFMVRQLDW